MALVEVHVDSGWRETDDVRLHLESFRAAIDDARRNGWRESDAVSERMERLLAATRPCTPAAPARPNPWRD